MQNLQLEQARSLAMENNSFSKVDGESSEWNIHGSFWCSGSSNTFDCSILWPSPSGGDLDRNQDMSLVFLECQVLK